MTIQKSRNSKSPDPLCCRWAKCQFERACHGRFSGGNLGRIWGKGGGINQLEKGEKVWRVKGNRKTGKRRRIYLKGKIGVFQSLFRTVVN